MAELVSALKTIVQHALQTCNAVASFNFRLVSSIIRAVSELGVGCATVVSNLAYAFAEIIYYIADIFLETTQLLATCVRLVQKFVLLVIHIIGAFLLGINAIVVWISKAILFILVCVTDGVLRVCDSLSSLWTSVTTATSVKTLCTDCRERLSKFGNYIATGLSERISACVIKFVEFLNYLGPQVEEKTHDIFLYIYKSLSGFVSDLTNWCVWIWSVTIAWIWSVTVTPSYVAFVYVKETLQCWYSVSSTFIVNTACGIPLQTYLYIIGTTVTLIVFKMLMEYLHKQGMTFPMFHFGSYSQVTRPRQHYIIDSSDEESVSEYEEDDEDYEDYDEGDQMEGQTDLGDLLHDADLESQMSGETEELDENSDTDEVEEFDIATDSESEGDGGNPIQIELPDRGGHYNLRVKASPVPTLGAGRINPVELERVLENERDKRLCVVCQDQLKTVLVLPCRHMCLCVDCAHEIANSRSQARRVCPLCRSRMETVMNVYV